MSAKQFILLVEDNPNDQLVMHHAFKKNNLADQLVVVRDGVEALEFLLGSSSGASTTAAQALPALVLLDARLPRLDGGEVLKRLRAHERTRHLPVILLSSCSEGEWELPEHLRAGVNGYQQKPFDFQEIVKMVGNLGLCWLKSGPNPASGSNLSI